MARYTGPKSKISRKYGEPIFGDTKALEKKPHPPGQHGRGRRRKKSEYAIQLAENLRICLIKHQEKVVLQVKIYYSY